MKDKSNIKYPDSLAKAVVRKVSIQVKSMLQGTKVAGNSHKENEDLELFEKNDLKLGKLLGVGGFSNVYEISQFVDAESTEQIWTHQKNLARKKFKENAFEKNGKPKYVVKHLRAKTMKDPNKFCMAASDLVVEAQFLKSLNHKNIIKLRGWASEGIESYSNGEHDDYFLILDRLYDTLDNRLKSWKEQRDFAYDSSIKHPEDLIPRVTVCYQIADALQYLHSKNIVFRDLKPTNVGFDKHDTVKLFDFGLSRELPEECINGSYHMSGMIGTLRYMAPEVALSTHYNEKIDTYSWATLFWSCLSLSVPHPTSTRSQYLNNVCRLGERLPLKDEWSDSIRNLLIKSWAHNPSRRIAMKDVCSELEEIELELTQDVELVSNNLASCSFIVRSSLIRNTSNTLLSFS